MGFFLCYRILTVTFHHPYLLNDRLLAIVVDPHPNQSDKLDPDPNQLQFSDFVTQ